MASTNMNTENLVRLVRVGNGSTRFCDNTIKTSKYEWWSFLAYNLFEQMKTTSNVYFFVGEVLIPRSSGCFR